MFVRAYQIRYSFLTIGSYGRTSYSPIDNPDAFEKLMEKLGLKVEV